MQMKKMNIDSLANEIRSAKFPVFICGAGISYGAAPLAQDLEDGLLSGIASYAENKNSDTFHTALNEIKSDYLTLELLVSAISFRVPELLHPIKELYRKLFRLQNINQSNHSIANCLASKQIGSILTANFDDGLYRCLDAKGASYRLITDANVKDSTKATDGDICAFHGTVYSSNNQKDTDLISEPTSITAQELAHPFIPYMNEYVLSVLDKADKIFLIGHRGEDFYDLNLTINTYVRENKEDVISKFYCIPHEGKMSNVSDFVSETFYADNIIELDQNKNWLATLCDLISGQNTEPTSMEPIEEQEIEETLLSLINDTIQKDIELIQRTKLQCKLLLEDIANGVLAVWSVAEHYRLESLAYSQQEIKAFGRPPIDKTFFDIPLAKIIYFQKRYWDFNKNLRNAKHDEAMNKVNVTAIELYNEMSAFSVKCKHVTRQLNRAIDKSCCLLMSSIVLDYMGLIAVRAEKNNWVTNSKLGTFSSDPISDLRYQNSWESAEQSEAFLQEDESLVNMPEKEKSKYLIGLGEIVPWKIWSIAPKENFARSNQRSIEEKIELLSDAIDFRMSEIQNGNTIASFSASGHSAQCVQRISELLRAVAGIEEDGQPDYSVSEGIESLNEIIEKQFNNATACLDVAAKSSSKKNPRFMSAFDALILAHMYHGKMNDAQSVLNDAERYANNDPGYASRLEQLRSRFS